MRGGTIYVGPWCPHQNGASPRARGNRGRPAPPPAPLGCIPACAGEPTAWHWRSSGRRVHPRVRGGTSRTESVSAAEPGASPRARGNLRGRLLPVPRAGCIPACAGEPAHRRRSPSNGRVHPRVRGGTLQNSLCSGDSHGCIPACAGEPTERALVIEAAAVHPRVRGGTDSLGTLTPDGWGASPRARGNRMPATSAPFQVGCIPACAGEPAAEVQAGPAVGVHPRVRGGTSSGAAP